MKNKIFVVVLVALMLAGGMILASCKDGDGCPSDGKCDLYSVRLNTDCYFKTNNDLTVYDCMPGALDTKCKC